MAKRFKAKGENLTGERRNPKAKPVAPFFGNLPLDVACEIYGFLQFTDLIELLADPATHTEVAHCVEAIEVTEDLSGNDFANYLQILPKLQVIAPPYGAGVPTLNLTEIEWGAVKLRLGKIFLGINVMVNFTSRRKSSKGDYYIYLRADKVFEEGKDLLGGEGSFGININDEPRSARQMQKYKGEPSRAEKARRERGEREDTERQRERERRQREWEAEAEEEKEAEESGESEEGEEDEEGEK